MFDFTHVHPPIHEVSTYAISFSALRRFSLSKSTRCRPDSEARTMSSLARNDDDDLYFAFLSSTLDGKQILCFHHLPLSSSLCRKTYLATPAPASTKTTLKKTIFNLRVLFLVIGRKEHSVQATCLPPPTVLTQRQHNRCSLEARHHQCSRTNGVRNELTDPGPYHKSITSKT